MLWCNEKEPPRCAFGLLPPKGELLPWGGPAAKKKPLATPSACCPPRGSFLPWGGPAAKKKPPRYAFSLLPPEGELFALGRPGGKEKAPSLRLRLALHLAACMPLGFARHTAVRNGLLCVQAHPQGGAFCLGAARRQKRPRAPLYHLCQNLQHLPLKRHKPQQTVHIGYREKQACASSINLWHKESFLIT
ncbi:hypothetical protein AFA_03455 [Alcaligenes faecalis]|uniref:Uncharacterized protein n=1 Tax=Alcaligenes faecalis TaxID=511 RepID=A0AB33CS30_ALCFA|nr:hypothetical protein AFA_03455 [Alcaligenes faecalis]